MFFILFVLHDTDALNDVLTAWEECGVSGVTILPSTGLARFRHKGGLREDLAASRRDGEAVTVASNDEATKLNDQIRDERTRL